MNPVYYDDYLQHYGVIGMKWGVRKGYQDAKGNITSKGNEYIKKVRAKAVRSDKSLTSFGKMHYGEAMDIKEHLVSRMDRVQRKIDKKGSTEKREKKLAKRKEEVERLSKRINAMYGDMPMSKLADARAFYEGQMAAYAAANYSRSYTNSKMRQHNKNYHSSYSYYSR